MNCSRRVLIVDRSEDTREVLKTALRRKGLQTLEAENADRGLALVADAHPDVVVLDLEVDSLGGDNLHEQFAAGTKAVNSALLVLGNARLRSPPLCQADSAEEFVRKPYHFRQLVQRIEALAGSLAGEPCRRRAA